MCGRAGSINNHGHVVGTADFCDTVDGDHVNCRARAFVYRGGSAFTALGALGGRDSNGRGIDDAGVVYDYPNAPGSNGHGQVVGRGRLSGQERGFLLTPTARRTS